MTLTETVKQSAKTVWCVTGAALTAAVLTTVVMHAQQLEPAAVPAANPTATPLPLTPTRSLVPPDPDRATADWLRYDSGATAALPAAAKGPAVRGVDVAAKTLVRRGVLLRGSYFARVALRPMAGELPAVFGLTLGGDGLLKASAIAFLLRDGDVAIERPDGTAVPFTQRAMPVLRTPGHLDEAVAEVLEVRVAAGQATFLVNDAVVAELTLTPGDLDGAAGVHVGGGADLLVTAFTTTDPAAAPRIEVGR